MPIPQHIQAIICDIDGCLSPESIGAADLASLATIANWQGPPLSLCTGRPLPFADAIARVVGALEIPSVCEGGVWLLDPTDYTWSMDPRITQAHLAAIGEYRAWIAENLEGVYFESGKSGAVTVFHRDGSEALREHVLPKIESEIKSRGWAMRASMTWTCINVELDFVSKATGLDRFLEATGSESSNLVGIGDTMSDLAIRDRVAWFACPANAEDELKACADYVANESEARGVVEIFGMLSR